MGGKALKKYGVFTERKDTEEFMRIGKKMQEIVKSKAGLDSAIVKCFHEKQDHGDLDLLIKIPERTFGTGGGINLASFVENILKPRAINNNGGVISFDFEEFQIDFIPIEESGLEIANTYFSYDPLGNIMGKTYHKFNLSYGWNGLYYKFRNLDGRIGGNIEMTKDPRKIFEFGDYDYDRYLKGFNSIDEIYDFVMKSKYFDTSIFQFEDFNHIDRKRNKKRKSYNEFLAFMNENNIGTNYTFDKNKENYIDMIDEAFPDSNLKLELEIIKKRDKFRRELADKFSGTIVMEWLPELKGKELGLALRDYKNSHGDGYEKYIMNHNIDQIKANFLALYNRNDL
jgi:hypothetical protein